MSGFFIKVLCDLFAGSSFLDFRIFPGLSYGSFPLDFDVCGVQPVPHHLRRHRHQNGLCEIHNADGNVYVADGSGPVIDQMADFHSASASYVWTGIDHHHPNHRNRPNHLHDVYGLYSDHAYNPYNRYDFEGVCGTYHDPGYDVRNHRSIRIRDLYCHTCGSGDCSICRAGYVCNNPTHSWSGTS